MSLFSRQPARIAVALGTTLLLLDLAACSSSSSGQPVPVSTPMSLSAASAALEQKITTETPRVVNSSVVTGAIAALSRTAALVPTDTGDANLGTIWDPNSGSAPINNEFAIENQYNGGNLTCDNVTNTCTNGTISVPLLESLKDFIGQDLDPNFQNSNGASDTLFGRLQFTSQLLCVFSQLTPAGDVDSDGLPDVGNLTLSFPSDTSNTVYQPVASGGCGMSTSLAGQSITATVTAVTSADYDKALSLDVGGSGISLWMRLDSTTGVFNIMSLQNESAFGRYAVNRTIANISGLNTSGSTQVLFEYIALGSNLGGDISCYQNNQWQCSYEYHRVYIDEASNQAYLVSNFGDSGDASGGTGAPTRYFQYTGAASPSVLKSCETSGSCTGTLALSFTADGQYSPDGSLYPSVGNAYDGCVNIDDRSIATDGSLGCDVSGASILAAGGASSMIEATREVYASDVVATLYDNTTADTTLAFTGASDIYTAPNTQ